MSKEPGEHREMDEDELLTQREAESVTLLSIRTLQRLAEIGEGPPRIRLTQRRIAYRRKDLMRWIESRAAATTKGGKTV